MSKAGLKAISHQRDRSQSQWLCRIFGPVLALGAVATAVLGEFGFGWRFLLPSLIISVVFCILALGLRAATPAAAAAGGTVCFLLTFRTQQDSTHPFHSALTPLATLFVLTFLATRAGRTMKAAAGIAEGRRGRAASQVIANLGAAGLVAFLLNAEIVPVLVLAALVEATADTVSSEIGQAFGGTPRMLTSFEPVPPGTDGAVTLLGTVAGVLGGVLVAASGKWAMHLDLRGVSAALAGGTAGLFFDSILGATAERRGWLGNDLVNFAATIFALVTACLLTL